MIIEKQCSKKEWAEHVLEMRQKGREQIADLMLSPTGIREFETGGVRYRSPFAGAYLKRDMAAPVTASASPAARVSPSPAPASAPVAERTVPRAPAPDLANLIERAIKAQPDGDDDDDDDDEGQGGAPPLAALAIGERGALPEFVGQAQRELANRYGLAVSQLSAQHVNDHAEKLEREADAARLAGKKRSWEDEQIAKRKALGIVGGRSTGGDALALAIEKQMALADMLGDAV
jgi:hypothetical protein